MHRLYLTGMSAAEVAAAVGVSVSTVKVRFRREGIKMRPNNERTDRWYANIATSKTKNGTWAKSQAEDRFALRFAEHGLSPIRNLNIGRFSIDFAFPDQKIAIEVDGATHRTRAAHDKKKDRALRKLGWKVSRIRLSNAAQSGKRVLPPLLRSLRLI
jgi:very-short-patch-repair endonuclease